MTRDDEAHVAGMRQAMKRNDADALLRHLFGLLKLIRQHEDKQIASDRVDVVESA